MQLKKHLSFSIIFTLFLASAVCLPHKTKAPLFYLSENLSWAPTDEACTPEEALFLEYKPLNTSHDRKLSNLVGTKGNYIWVKINFNIPENLKNQDLGFVIEYLHFAEKAWINGNYIGEYGAFPPNEKSALWVGHYYFIPKQNLNQNEENTLLLKIWCHGSSKISRVIFLTDSETAKYKEGFFTFIHSRLYMVFEGGMFATFLLFMILFLGRRKDPHYMVFALANLYTLQMAFILFGQENPFYNYANTDYLVLIKYYQCTCFLLAFYFMQSFVIRFMFNKSSKTQMFIRLSLTTASIIAIWIAPTYNALMDMTIPIIVIMILQFGITVFYLVKALSDSKFRRRAIIVLIGFTPFLLCVIADFILRIEKIETNSPPFHGFYGWQLTIIYFLTVLTIRFNRTLRQNEYLNKNLSKEVQIQTAALNESNLQLEKQIEKNRKDLKMASIVQQKFFPHPNRAFLGWDISILYRPLQEVSGDLYDYYKLGNVLEGFSLFDVSGHGISSSLITVLAKNILSQEFKQNRIFNKNASTILTDFNKKLIEAKGSVDNYLTGIICLIKQTDDNGNSQLQLANAGHPYPILYSAKNNNISEIKAENQENFGAIGLYESNINFVDCDFNMEENDILVSFTDGITESCNEHGEQFGKTRLMEIIQNNCDKSSKEISNLIIYELNKFTENNSITDDITLIIIKKDNPENYIEEISG